QFGNGHSRVRFAQEADDLFFGESFLHIQSPCVVDWTLKSRATQYRGDVGGGVNPFGERGASPCSGFMQQRQVI
ncbi:hypothetical protein, partial [Chromobacterium violaceum]|uniref:hypothetical protein n=1 Tax=Chromobacterium violaceum TaxID=536 RepID=UPI001B31A4AF